ncbi:MAG: aminotransferase class V-fold PLP-dependent enzyme [Hyphomicrobiales bacterium]|nr:aminotransferase class V-fold PLP-dependent enzyme [Hyphomicrobiales bacterium]MCP5001843.1 aminotransferase class V-fold PLP-dependent enzyme [Hyphomicrobiales bacterium]
MMLDKTDLAKEARALDAGDRIASICSHYEQPKGWIFFDANSVGPAPKSARDAANGLVDDWVNLRRRGWAERDWVDMPSILGDRIAPMIGAGPGEVVVCDNTTVNLYKATGHALAVNSDRATIVTQAENFPTDLHVLQGFERFSDRAIEIRRVDTEDEAIAAMDETVALGSFSHVGYKSGVRWDMAKVNAAAHDRGALVLWDVSHSAGAVPIDVQASDADYIVGCGYKYLSTGPGGPAYVYVRPDLVEKAWPPMCGWMGHADIYAFSGEYVPHAGIKRFISGTPMVGANAIALCAADIYANYDPKDIWERHRSLSEFFVRALEAMCGEYGVEITSPMNHGRRGGHVSFRAPGAGSVVEALIDAKVVSSFRKPDSIRFGISPTALSHHDIYEAVRRLREIMVSEIWKDPKYEKVSV